MITNRPLTTLMKLVLISVLIQNFSAQSTSTLLDNKPLIQIQNLPAESENEIDDTSSRGARHLNLTSDVKPANSVFDDVYEKCLVNLSFPCLQRKMLVYMNKVDRVKGVNLLSNIVSVVRTSDDHTPEITEEDLEKKLSPAEEETQLESLMEHQVDKFMDNHVIRLQLPEGITAGLTNSNKGRSYSIAGNALDISLARMFSIVEGRGKGGGGGGGKMKGMKKMMGMMMMGVMGKLAMLMPMMMMMLKMKVMKALIIAKLALALSLIQVFKMMMSGGGKGKMGGGGSKEVIIVHDNHGDSGSSGGGWSSGGGSSGGGWSSGGSSGGHGGGGGWSSGGGHGGDSYSSGAHHGGGDATYGGGDAGGGGWSSGGSGGGGWGKRSWDAGTPTSWPMYRGYAGANAEE
ncbi:hypothetical protein M8J75_011833 [Diaphorina citri]|nr:hypothetical protein M8J75_011833 [Diaphorina citri]